MHNGAMSPSELDTKAPSVPLHPFKVGDRVRRITDGVLKQYEVMKLSPRWKTDLFIREQSTGTEFWCNAESVQLDPGANEGKTIAPGIAAWLKNSKGEKFEVPEPEDAVNHPNHYTAGTLETIDSIEALVGQAGWSPATGYRLGNVLKYLWRHAHKGGLESLKKARWYLDREIAAVEKAQEKKP